MPGPGFDPGADGEYLRRATREYLGDQADCDLEVVRVLDATPSGKFLFSRSSVTPAFLAPGLPRGPHHRGPAEPAALLDTN